MPNLICPLVQESLLHLLSSRVAISIWLGGISPFNGFGVKVGFACSFRWDQHGLTFWAPHASRAHEQQSSALLHGVKQNPSHFFGLSLKYQTWNLFKAKRLLSTWVFFVKIGYPIPSTATSSWSYCERTRIWGIPGTGYSTRMRYTLCSDSHQHQIVDYIISTELHPHVTSMYSYYSWFIPSHVSHY